MDQNLIEATSYYLEEDCEPVVIKVAAEFLRESSWSRVLQHIEKTPSFAVISAFRGVNTPEENEELHKTLKTDVRALGYGFIEQDSGYSYNDPSTGEDGLVQEKSVFIPNISFGDAMNLGKKYGQESILYKDDNVGFALVYTTDGNGHKAGDADIKFQHKVGGKNITFDPETLKIAFSALKQANKTQKGKPFAYKVEEDYTIVSLKEAVIPTRTEAMISGYKNKKLAAVTWKSLI